ncbi:hypothetical protein PC116_g6678 [Phytophthora cactorum]|nr:hypothetical protein PC111_g21873 [Phytophthora cactorum]KAG4245511.1 hypothetical protein PC116_g6678 [Phytophthora cactorum]
MLAPASVQTTTRSLNWSAEEVFNVFKIIYRHSEYFMGKFLKNMIKKKR